MSAAVTLSLDTALTKKRTCIQTKVKIINKYSKKVILNELLNFKAKDNFIDVAIVKLLELKL